MTENTHPYDAARLRLAGMVLPKVAELNRLADRWLEHRLKRQGISLAEFRVVGALLGECGGLSQRDLAERLGVRPATVSGALPQLERKGMVERLDDPNDARTNLVRLRRTEKELGPVIDIVDELEQLLFGAVSADDRARLQELLGAAARRIAPEGGAP